ncbi:MAG: trypsin-like peptidase domain-containing protein, partial [Verrucomicrobiota bacterium]
LDLARQLNQAFIEVADKVSTAVVVIQVVQKESARSSEDENSFWDMFPPELRKRFEERNGQENQRPSRRRPVMGSGSGIIVTEDGYILTNNHVVEDAEKITVRFKDSRTFTAEIRGVDPQSDLAVIKINAKGLVPAKMGDSAATRVGEFAIAVGAPFQLDYSVTIGHVSAKGRSVLPNQMMGDQDFIQTDASINPGNSGGPLVNLYGEVIGVNSMIHGMNTGIGFAIPSNLAKQVMQRLIQDGKFTRSVIGVAIRDLREFQDYKSDFPSLEDGVVIDMILPKGPAAKSDLKAGDVIVAVDGKTVKTSRELKEEIAYKKVGQSVNLDVVRLDASRKAKNLKIKLNTDAFPTNDQTVSESSEEKATVEPTSFGLTVRPLTDELGSKFKIKTRAGVIVTAVDPESAAADNGLQPGDVITEVNRSPVSNLKQFRDAIAKVDPKKGMILNLISKGASRFVVLRED